MGPHLTRGDFLAGAGASLLATLAPRPATAETTMQTRAIPATGEAMPVIGLGTWQTFDVGGNAAMKPQLRQVLDRLFAAGGKMIDSSPMYGTAEAVTGELLADMGAHKQAFLATKVWTSGREPGVAQMRQSAE